MNTNKLMEMYKSTFKPALKEGVYNVKLIQHKYVANKDNPYVRFDFEIVDGESKGRQLNDNKFEKGFGVLISHLRQQLHREDEEINVQDFLNELIEKQTVFKIWVVKRTVNGYPRTNFNYLEPIKETKPNLTVVEDTVEDSTEDTAEEIETTEEN